MKENIIFPNKSIEQHNDKKKKKNDLRIKYCTTQMRDIRLC